MPSPPSTEQLVPLRYARHPEAPPEVPPLAVRFQDLVLFGGHVAAHPVRGVPDDIPEAPGRPFHGSPIERQARFIYDDMSRTLDELGSSIADVLKINSYHLHGSEADMALRARRDYFGDEFPPPSTLVIVNETTVPGTTVTIDVVALATDNGDVRIPIVEDRGDGGQVAVTDSIYGRRMFIQAARGGGLIFTVGVGPRALSTSNPESLPLPGEQLVHPRATPLPVAAFPYRSSRIEVQTEAVLRNLQGILSAAGASFEHVVRAEVHLSDMRYLAGFNRVWERFFPVEPPARIIVPADMARPDAMLVEVELIAVDPKGPYRKETIRAADVPDPLGPEPQAVRAGPYLFLSTQLATDYVTGVASPARVDPDFPFHRSEIELQTAYILANVDKICRAAGTSPRNLLRRRAVHRDLADLPDAERIWTEQLGDRLPPTTTFKVDHPLAVPACRVQYDLIAAIP